MPYLKVRDVNYFVEVTGVGRPLLLLHGFTGSGQNWQPLLPDLVNAFQVMRLDLLGHGRTDSAVAESRYSMAQAAADLITILDTLAVKDSIIAGYSMGGRLALYTAVTYPQRFKSVILESASPGLKTEAERQARVKHDRELAAWIEANGVEVFVNRWETLPLWQSQQSLSAEKRLALRQQRLQNSAVGLAQSLRGMGTGAQPAQWEALADLEAPTLLIVGEQDQKFVAINRRMAAVLPQSKLQIVSGAGHTVHWERPSQFTQIVLSFLQKR